MTSLRIGDPMPPIPTLPGADWRSYSDEHAAGADVFVVAFICNHCPHVHAVEGRLKAFAGRYKENGVAMMAINSSNEIEFPEETYEQMVLRARTHEYGFPYLRDADQMVARAFGAAVTPEFFVFDRQRRLRYHGALDDSGGDPDGVRTSFLIDAVDALLRGEEIVTPVTSPVGCRIGGGQDEA